ncbi:hypothetical protein IIV31_096L [Armadillidium vulgare iridescent virus]|uniref:Uncharacterized protein n=1 Tax=Armadillidium vulgare iridescent virus TaxID=72201 RepID=A0A068QKU8_9VIRU|nr:hypothetical protein IIV31_096L [Armadillidium vulgare iridescent virus]CCV02468.1 hypothetical protein IIV31_096L [Armadillidium vulgare iridescent virus]
MEVKAILSIELMEEIVKSLVKAHLTFANKALEDDAFTAVKAKIVVFVTPEAWKKVRDLPIENTASNWRVRKDKKYTYFLSESLQSSSLNLEALQLFKSVAEDDIQIPNLSEKLVEENEFIVLLN